MRFSAALAALLAGSAFALPSTTHVVHETRSERAARGLAKKMAAPTDQLIPMKIALSQNNLVQIPHLLDDVANPLSPNYGKHWTGDQLAAKFAPSRSSAKAVGKWLSDAGLKAKLSASRHWIEFEASVEEAEKLLKTKFHVYSNSGDGKEFIGCDDYSLPGHVREHVDFITPTVSLGELKRSVVRKRDASAYQNTQHTHFTHIGAQGAEGEEAPVPYGASTTSLSVKSCAQGATPECIKALYSLPNGTTANSGNELGIYESEDYYDQNDLNMFFTKNWPQIANGTGPVVNSVDGGQAPAQASGAGGSGVGGESVLDLEIAFPLIHPQGVRLLQVDDAANARSEKRGHLDSLLDALDSSFCSFMGGDNSTYDFEYPDAQPNGWNGTSKMCGTYTPPNVISISYGYQEDQFSATYLTRQCLEFAKLSLAGTTIVASSGDSGVSAPYCGNTHEHVATPQFPASCPYVTTVGATALNMNATSLTADDAEVAGSDSMSDFKSGSGFSSVFPMPDWQKNAVTQYLASVASPNASVAMQPGTNFNASGRAYPDVAALGTHIGTVTNGAPFLADGTSASAPIFASMITLINEERLSNGKRPVGFINPALYQAGAANSAVFRDVTEGDNGGCGMPGFTATKGWDAVTGWGSPKWEGLRELLVSL